MINRFNIRVYGLMIHEGRVLVMEEHFKGKPIFKFPGGGLEFGEGLGDCLKREFEEEMGLKVSELEHFYTTEDFIQSAFRKEDQLISVYYRVEVSNFKDLNFKPESKGDWVEKELHWFPVKEISKNDLSLPVDQRVAEMLRSQA